MEEKMEKFRFNGLEAIIVTRKEIEIIYNDSTAVIVPFGNELSTKNIFVQLQLDEDDKRRIIDETYCFVNDDGTYLAIIEKHLITFHPSGKGWHATYHIGEEVYFANSSDYTVQW